MTQPRCSPDLAPCNFWHFPKLKSHLTRKRFRLSLRFRAQWHSLPYQPCWVLKVCHPHELCAPSCHSRVLTALGRSMGRIYSTASQLQGLTVTTMEDCCAGAGPHGVELTSQGLRYPPSLPLEFLELVGLKLSMGCIGSGAS